MPLIQVTDCCREVVAAESNYKRLLGQRVLVRDWMRTNGFDNMAYRWMGNSTHGAFAEYVKVPVTEAFPVDCDWRLGIKPLLLSWTFLGSSVAITKTLAMTNPILLLIFMLT